MARKKAPARKPAKRAAAKRSMAASPKARAMAQEKQWQAQQDLSTLRQADEIKSDRGRMARAKSEARKAVAAITKATK